MSALTKEDVGAAVACSLGPNYEVLEYHLESFAKQKNGIFGNHQLLTVKVESKLVGKAKACTFFVKSPPESDTIRNDVMDPETFLEEIHFYKEIQPAMASCGTKWSPQCYLIKGDVLVFEDLRAQGYRAREDLPLDEMDFLRSSLSALARFHAASIATEAKIGKSLREAYPTAFAEKMYSRTNKFGKCTLVGFETIGLMAKKLGIGGKDHLIGKMYELGRESVRYREGRCNVSCHSDLWKNNLLFSETGSAPKCLLVDFQLLRYASPACDLGMLVYLHTTPAFRRKFEFELFDHYYSALRDAVLRSGVGAVVPEYGDLVEDYRQLRLIGMIYAALYLPGIYLRPEDFARLLNDAGELEKWFFADRMTVIGATMDADPAYEEKIRDILEELFEEARRIFHD
ncbi:uncharacterized protein LOC106644110 [Copidosoma floridanum]|uniref:uncharacterized protein LOC106644110 n=1 Tax=Copidosoma floridanum TaxID=29053 RepID=UPI0006C97958|nr:uncharacterized protein LOC106644110 [Copidosoma floridanum]